MTNQDDSITNNKEEKVEVVPHFKSSMFWILLTVSFLTIIFGIFTVTSVIVDTIQQNQLNFPDTVIVGFLLLVGGIVLLGGTYIMKNWAPLPQMATQDDTSDIKK
jgi:hypothetical protein